MTNFPYRLQHLNTYSPVDSAVWEALEGADLMVEVNYLGWALRVYTLTLLQLLSLLVLSVGDVISWLPVLLSAAMTFCHLWKLPVEL